MESAPLTLYVGSAPDGKTMSVQTTCYGFDPTNPQLEWTDKVKGRAHAVLMQDPDAPGGDFYHWVVWWVHPDLTSLPMGVPTSDLVFRGERMVIVQGLNTAGTYGYHPACPPHGTGVHRYVFRVWRLPEGAEPPDGWEDAGPEEFLEWVEDVGEAVSDPYVLRSGSTSYLVD